MSKAFTKESDGEDDEHAGAAVGDGEADALAVAQDRAVLDQAA